MLRAATGRAIMQYNGTQAYMEGDKVAVLQKDLPVQQFRYREGVLTPEPKVDERLAMRAIAHAAWSSMAYERGLYRSPSSPDRPL